MGKQGLAPALVSLYAPSPLMATGASRSAAGSPMAARFTLQEVDRGMGKQRDKAVARVG